MEKRDEKSDCQRSHDGRAESPESKEYIPLVLFHKCKSDSLGELNDCLTLERSKLHQDKDQILAWFLGVLFSIKP